MTDQQQIPEQWLSLKIGEVADVVAGGTPKASDPDNFAEPGTEIAWLTPADLSKYSDKYIAHGFRDLSLQGYEKSSAKLIPAGSLLFSSRAPIGYVAVAANEISTNQGFKNFVLPSGIDSSYGYYFLRSIRSVAESMGTGTTFKEISGANAKKLPFILAPLAEQKVIANKLDTLLAQVENTKARLERIPQILKRFRQSVLAAAVSGRLTEEWRDNPAYQTFESFDIPETWTTTTIGEIAEVKGGKRLPKGEELVSEDTGFPYIRAGQLKNGTVIVGEEGRNVQMYITASVKEQISRYTVKAGDAYITIVGASIGDAGIIPATHSGANLTENAAKLTDYKLDLAPNYLSYWLRSEYLQELIRRETKSAAQGKLALNRIKSLPFPYPPIEEQTEIVRQVDQLFAHADRIEQQVNNALTRVNNLTQSILAKAFRGELTEQWRKDNPELISGENSAEALLERINAERAATKPAKRRRRTVSA